MPDRKIRIGVRCGGKEKNLISVKESKSGDLRISTTNALHFEDGGDNLVIKASKYSVHHSARNPHEIKTTIKRETIIEGGVTTEIASLIHNQNNLMAQVIFAECALSFSDEKYNLIVKTNEEHVSIGDFENQDNTLVYAAVISGKDWPIETLTDENWNLFIVDFTLFRVAVVWLFLQVPSMPLGSTVEMMTSLPVWNKSEPHQLSITPENPSVEDIKSSVGMLLHHAINYHINRVIKHLTDPVPGIFDLAEFEAGAEEIKAMLNHVRLNLPDHIGLTPFQRP